MLETWLQLPHWLMFLVLIVGFVGTGTLIFALSFNRWIRDHVLGYVGVVPPYVNVLAVLLALLTGFVASDTWERQRHAKQVVQAETDNVLAVYDLSIASPANMSLVRGALRDYVKTVLEDEWPKMAKGEQSTKVGDALAHLMVRVSLPQIGKEAGATTQTALLNAVLRIRSARGERLSINEHESDHTKWLVLLILGLLTQCAIGIVHLERPRAHAAALTIFTAGLISTLGLIAEHQWPFEGRSAIKPTALQKANVRIWKGGFEVNGPRTPDEPEPDWATFSARKRGGAAPTPGGPAPVAPQGGATPTGDTPAQKDVAPK